MDNKLIYKIVSSLMKSFHFTDLQDPVIGALSVENIEAIIRCEPDQSVCQDVPVSDPDPRDLQKPWSGNKCVNMK